ncbi:MAG: transposase [Crenarchaeota archaeon]|nr:transposase [Thermoproteota archaeon]
MSRVKNRIIYVGVDLNSRNIDVAAIGYDIPFRIVEHVLPLISRARIREPEIVNVVGNISVAHIYTAAPGSDSYYVNLTIALRILKTLMKELSIVSTPESIPILCIENMCSTVSKKGKISIVEKICDIFMSKILENARLIEIVQNNPVGLKKRSSIWGLLYANKRYRTGIMIIDPYLTSRICSTCLYYGNVNLCRMYGRYVECSIHGRINRDVNAAVNMALLCKKVVDEGLPPAGPSPVPQLHGGWWGSCRRSSGLKALVGLGAGGLVAGGGPEYYLSSSERALLVDVSYPPPENMSFFSTISLMWSI